MAKPINTTSTSTTTTPALENASAPQRNSPASETNSPNPSKSLCLPQDSYGPTIRKAPPLSTPSRPDSKTPQHGDAISSFVTTAAGLNTSVKLSANSSVARNQALVDATRPQVEPKRMPEKIKGKGSGKAKMRKKWHAHKKAIRAAAPERAAAHALHSQTLNAAKTLRVATSTLDHSLTSASVALNVTDVIVDGPTTTTVGTTTNAVLTGALTVGISKVPPLVIADAITGGEVSDHYKGTASVITVTAEGLITGDTTGMESFHEKSKNGEYGTIMREASEAGDYWAEKGVVGGLKEFGSAVWSLF